MSLSPAAKALGDQPAFPVVGLPRNSELDGLTKREWMAVEMAMGISANSSIDSSYEKVGEMALKQADALLEALVKQEEQK